MWSSSAVPYMTSASSVPRQSQPDSSGWLGHWIVAAQAIPLATTKAIAIAANKSNVRRILNLNAFISSLLSQGGGLLPSATFPVTTAAYNCSMEADMGYVAQFCN